MQVRAFKVAVSLAVALAVAGLGGWLLITDSTERAGTSSRSGPVFNRVVAAEVVGLERQGMTRDQAERGIEVQGAIDAARLPSRIETAMGKTFGGIWFAPATGALHVGVTSEAGRRIVERVAARAGLADEVFATPVRSTWDQLLAAVERWNKRLAPLFARSEVTTALLPQHNVVRVRLASAVPRATRVRVERAASSAGVNVLVRSLQRPKLSLETQASRCSPFAANEAFCDPTIVAGVSIISKEVDEETERCTAGPAVITKDLSKETTETFLLTAGHCIEDGGKVGNVWYAWNKKGKEQKKEEIGKAIKFVNDEDADVGLIKIENSFWIDPKSNTPVIPAIAPWKEAEPEPFPVTASTTPVVGHTSCFSGQTTGTDCGTIVSLTGQVGGTKNLVEVNGVETGGGDSGGPWYSSSTSTPPLAVEGTHVGLASANHPVFEPLATTFKEFAEYELLTEANETRPQCPMKVECGGGGRFTASATGELTAQQASDQTFTASSGGTQVICHKAHTTGAIVSTEANSQAVTVEYTECHAAALGNPIAEISPAKYVLFANGNVEIVENITIKIPALGCSTVVTGGQTVSSASYDNVIGGKIEQTSSLTSIHATSTGLCPSGTTGTYTGNNLFERIGGGTLAWDSV